MWICVGLLLVFGVTSGTCEVDFAVIGLGCLVDC
jgi:hypothetical protein